jgi:hypothetical protein
MALGSMVDIESQQATSNLSSQPSATLPTATRMDDPLRVLGSNPVQLATSSHTGNSGTWVSGESKTAQATAIRRTASKTRRDPTPRTGFLVTECEGDNHRLGSSFVKQAFGFCTHCGGRAPQGNLRVERSTDRKQCSHDGRGTRLVFTFVSTSGYPTTYRKCRRCLTATEREVVDRFVKVGAHPRRGYTGRSPYWEHCLSNLRDPGYE